MRFLRRRLSVLATVWLTCQVASLSALAVADWDALQRPLSEIVKDCLKVGTGDQCPMLGADGQPCPMHQKPVEPDHRSERACSLRGAPDGPNMVLANLFAFPGVLIGAVHAHADVPVLFTLVVVDHASSAPFSHDTPPPRS